MPSVQSKDGTQINFDRVGEGPPLILVDGAMCYRQVGWSTKLAKRLVREYTVFSYDRRGRGRSGDTAPYAAEREIEDLQALIAEAGGSVSLFAHSSGCVLALETAARDAGVRKLVLYEAPLDLDGLRAPGVEDYPAKLHALLDEDRRGDAVKLFLRQIGLPGPIIALIRLLPMWPKMAAIAHTLSYDNAIVALAKESGKQIPDRWTAVTLPTLAVAGGRSPEWMRRAMQTLAGLLPNAQFRLLKGQTHNIKPKAHAPLLTEFLSGEGNTRLAADTHIAASAASRGGTPC
jgi:pimeloyl-ACP methyl ester carboxylesterase